jgi:hypothetical protein
MKKYSILCILILSTLMLELWGCSRSMPPAIPVPFRVSNKFGVSDTKGQLLIEPQFDWITISDRQLQVLTGYTQKNNVVLSSLIYGNKILLRDQPYKSYYLTNDLFTAVEFRVTDATNRRFNDRFVTRFGLYTIKGEQLIKGTYSDIQVLNGIGEDSLKQALVATTDTTGNHALLVYDRGSREISGSYVKNSRYMRITNNSAYDYKNKAYTIVYKDENGNGRQMVVWNNGEHLKLASDKPFKLDPSLQRSNDQRPWADFPDTRAFNDTPYTFRDTTSTVGKTYRVTGQYYYLPDRPEQLVNSIELLPDNMLVTRNGKRGLKSSRNGVMTIPIIYDEVIRADFNGSAGYILRSGNRYQVYYYNKKFTILPTFFDKIPMAITGYLPNGLPLIKLYNANGKFFCYADSSGKPYYCAK